MISFEIFKDDAGNWYVELCNSEEVRGYAFPTDTPDVIAEMLEYVGGLEDEYTITTSASRIIISSKGEDCDATFTIHEEDQATALDVLNKYKELVGA